MKRNTLPTYPTFLLSAAILMLPMGAHSISARAGAAGSSSTDAVVGVVGAVADSIAIARQDTIPSGVEADSIDLPDDAAWRDLQEVVVTAKENKGLTTASRIDRDAMNHLQPTSFSDLLELLPGNISHDPDMSRNNAISLRETGNLGATGSVSDNPDYAISSLGTLFMVDGAPVNGDANLQSIGTSTDDAADRRSSTNRGVDMRSISTDNIESVEIVRGIPSAEYGNLTSGMVSIKRSSKSTPFTARFKADEYSKLFSAGKGLALGQTDHVLSADISYLDSKADPRNNLETYKRLTGSLRMAMKWTSAVSAIKWNYGLDYTGSFDNQKSDPDLSYRKVDEYRSSYNRTAFTSDLDFELFRPYVFNHFNVNASLSYEQDIVERRKQVAPQRASVAPTTMAPGVSIGHYLLSEYIADYRNEGKPLNAFLKARASGDLPLGPISNNYKIGLEWTLSKNFGHGEMYDLERPLSASWTSRPRDFNDIPELNVLSFFLEEEASLNVGQSLATLRLGLRSIQLPSLPKDYYLHNRPYLDPRVNASWAFPKFAVAGSDMAFTLTGGYGLTTRMPTIDYLFPQDHYNDIVQLNYYDVANPAEHSLVSLMTYIQPAANKDLRPARNRKWELRLGAQWHGFSVDVTYFDERLNSGFRYSTYYAPYEYTRYDASAINGATLTAPPDLSTLPHETVKKLDGYRVATNGTLIYKQGVEFQLNTPRWQALRTSLIISGAWFHSVYSNSQKLYSAVSDVVDGAPVSDRYVGLYDYTDGRINDQVNTNFMFDTQIPRWGLVFTTTLQCMWRVRTTRMPIDGVPIGYLDAVDGLLHDWTPDAALDPTLRYLIKTYNAESFNMVEIPFAGYLNLKATKKIGKWMRVALFVNRLLDWLPSYRSNGLIIRRSANPYFGMEINLTL
ncbi:MAG: TonB-dependent receptor plug domain-containing protein [Muribaculaceae bacterium]|nr:TonB-dependent receptor plug domain-containing protein [Muribaculaceae bacterium]